MIMDCALPFFREPELSEIYGTREYLDKSEYMNITGIGFSAMGVVIATQNIFQ